MNTLGAKQYFSDQPSVDIQPWSEQFELRTYYTIEEVALY
mgnify:CR=1 FL=1